MISIPTSNISLVIDPAISWGNYMPLDLSVTNPTIEKVKASSSADWEIYINELLARNGKKIAFGGYLEKRNIYQRSEYFKDAANDRNIHLGIDFWIAAGTSVTPLQTGLFIASKTIETTEITGRQLSWNIILTAPLFIVCTDISVVNP